MSTQELGSVSDISTPAADSLPTNPAPQVQEGRRCLDKMPRENKHYENGFDKSSHEYDGADVKYLENRGKPYWQWVKTEGAILVSCEI